MSELLPPERRARLAGSASAAGALTVVVWVPVFIGPDPLAALLAFCLATLAIFATVEGAAGIRGLTDRGVPDEPTERAGEQP